MFLGHIFAIPIQIFKIAWNNFFWLSCSLDYIKVLYGFSYLTIDLFGFFFVQKTTKVFLLFRFFFQHLKFFFSE